MALEIDAKNATATATATGDATGKAKAKENKNNNVPAAGEKNLVNGSSAATKKKGALTTTFYPPLYISSVIRIRICPIRTNGIDCRWGSDWSSAILVREKTQSHNIFTLRNVFFYNALNAAAAAPSSIAGRYCRCPQQAAAAPRAFQLLHLCKWELRTCFCVSVSASATVRIAFVFVRVFLTWQRTHVVGRCSLTPVFKTFL